MLMMPVGPMPTENMGDLDSNIILPTSEYATPSNDNYEMILPPGYDSCKTPQDNELVMITY